MDDKKNDWRLQGQEKYGDKTTTTHQAHCEFYSDKLPTTIPNCLTEVDTTTDHYYWMCEKFYLDLKNGFKWTIIKQQTKEKLVLTRGFVQVWADE